jgi:tetratricopeptide (TPR) repeat protein
MNVKITILITLLFVNYGIGQIKESEINGKWIKYKSEMKDGSKILPTPNSDSTFLEISIKNSKLCFNSNPIYKTNGGWINFSLTENTINTSIISSIKAGYEIEKINKDTLIICEKMDDLKNDKLKRYYLVNDKILYAKELEKRKEEKNIIASKLFTPKLNIGIEGEIFKTPKSDMSNFDLIGSLTIFPSKKLVTSEINYSSTKKTSKIEIVSNIINNSFNSWDLTNFEKFESIKIPFIFRSESTEIFKGIKMIFFTNKISEFDFVYRRNLVDMRKSDELFQKGIKAYSEKKYIKAAEYFAESFKTDPENLDALYNKAAAYYEGGDKENACKTWKELVDLGQTNGIELYKNNCN